jgi:hypothetical protein
MTRIISLSATGANQMTAKTSTIKLAYHPSGNPAATGPSDPAREAWVVLSLTDSIEYHPRQRLLKEDVAYLCSSNRWKVTIVDQT